MKHYLFLTLLLLLLSCEDKVDIPLPDGQKQLVVEATGIQYENSDQAILTVRLTETTGFYANAIPPVTQAEVNIEFRDSIYDVYPLDSLTGVYGTVLPVEYEQIYRLNVHYNNAHYTAETHAVKGAEIDSIFPNENGGFDPDQRGVNVRFTDPPEADNCYLFQYSSDLEQVLRSLCDDQFNGNSFSTFYSGDFETGDTLRVDIQGVDQRFENYFEIISQQSSDSGNPFATAPSTARGNIINKTHPEEKALGYFRISQNHSKIFIFNQP